jgi:hypothetical protein
MAQGGVRQLPKQGPGHVAVCANGHVAPASTIASVVVVVVVVVDREGPVASLAGNPSLGVAYLLPRRGAQLDAVPHGHKCCSVAQDHALEAGGAGAALEPGYRLGGPVDRRP